MLVAFIQSGVDNVPLNEVLEFRFSEPVNPATISPASIQIRKGSAHGATAPGTFEVSGSSVLFRPELPTLCDLSDAGFDANTVYRVQIIGWREGFAIENLGGQKLDQTTTWEFRTRGDQDPQRFRDQAPGAAPFVTGTAPASGTAAVDTAEGADGGRQRVVLTMSENLDPCSVGPETVTIQVYERGDAGTLLPAPNGNNSGFASGGDVSDQLPGDATSWGATTSIPWPGGPQTLPASIHLVQDFNRTQIVVSPLFGQDPRQPELGGTFPDNVLIVVRLAFGIEDFGREPLAPFVMSFTTENNGPTGGSYRLLADGETRFLPAGTTADVNTARAPSRVQAYLFFAGDGDNGLGINSPTLPNSDASGCTAPFKVNDGTDDFLDPIADVILDSGPANTCVNDADGSTAVIWEFATLRVRSGVTVRMVGSNPSLLLVNGDVLIETNGTLLARGDGIGGTPNSNGGNGDNTAAANQPTARSGGSGVLGGGKGGNAQVILQGNGNDGWTGVGSPDGRDAVGGHGPGLHNRNAQKTGFAAGGGARGGGAGGHSGIGANAVANAAGPQMIFTHTGTGLGGAAYPSGPDSNLLLMPSAGSGGGSGGYLRSRSGFAGDNSTGGAGGAGGGFLGITASGNINIFGTLSANGGRGGAAAAGFRGASGGGGGGSGGGLRLLTPNDINLNGGTVTAAGGAGGGAAAPAGGGVAGGAGADGAAGRIVMEDGDSVITGFGSAITIPTEGDDGFYRGAFDAGRFQAGGLQPRALTDLIFMGPIDPTYGAIEQSDFVAGVPTIGSPGIGHEVMRIEVRGFQLTTSGQADVGSATAWQEAGRFVDSGIESAPTWTTAAGFGGLDGHEYLQFRITLTLGGGVGAFDPGAFIDTWEIRFSSDL